MNTLALCFGYRATPWLNFDNGSVPVNFFSPKNIRRFFEGLTDIRLANTIKSHHSLSFFDHNLDFISRHFKILYIYRHPLTTLRSFWKFIENIHWVEGPKGLDCNAFMQAAPMGHCMRFQMTQEPTMLHRWTHHVDGWLKVSRENTQVLTIRYEDLDRQFQRTVEHIGSWINAEPIAIIRPNRYRNVILPSKNIDYEAECVFTKETFAFLQTVAGGLINELGYDSKPGMR